MIELIKTNIPGYVKDKQSPMILNTDMGKLKNILNNRTKKKVDDQFKKDFYALQEQVKELKDLLIAVTRK